MKQVKENSGSPSIHSNTKKTTVERQFYVCFCAKSYNSYSALYLHSKKKHDQNLTMKCLKYKKHEWSGNVKNIYYQFVQQNEGDNSNDEQSLILPCSRKKSSKQSPKNMLGLGNFNNEKRNQQVELVQQKLLDPFTKYIEQKKQEKDFQIRSNVIIQFLKYITNNCKLIASDHTMKQLWDQQFHDIVPHVMNNFFVEFFPNSIYSQHTIIKQLARFSDWLYNKAYSKYLAVEQRLYKQFCNKIQIIKQECS